MTLIEQFAAIIANTRFEDLPAEVIETSKERFLDSLAALVAGYRDWHLTDSFLTYCRQSNGSVETIGCPYGLSVPEAGMAFATIAAAGELDDGHKNAGVHCGAIATATALAAYRDSSACIQDVLTGYVFCYEVMYRLACEMSKDIIARGAYPTSILGGFGTVALASCMYRLSEKQIADALGIVSMLSSGMMEVIHNTPEIKGLLVGKAVQNGLQAVQLVMAGIPGPHTGLDGKAGLFQILSPNVDTAIILQGFGQTFHIRDTYTKLYPTCRHTHGAIEATAELAAENGIAAEDVASLNVGVYKVAMNLTGNHLHPKDKGEAKFSLHYCAATAIVQHGVSMADLTMEAIASPKIWKLSEKVNVTMDPELEDKYPMHRGTKVTVQTKDGRIFQKECFQLKGSPEKPISLEGIEKKLKANAVGLLPPSQINLLIDTVKNLEQDDSLTIIQGLLTKIKKV